MWQDSLRPVATQTRFASPTGGFDPINGDGSNRPALLRPASPARAVLPPTSFDPRCRPTYPSLRLTSFLRPDQPAIMPPYEILFLLPADPAVLGQVHEVQASTRSQPFVHNAAAVPLFLPSTRCADARPALAAAGFDPPCHPRHLPPGPVPSFL